MGSTAALAPNSPAAPTPGRTNKSRLGFLVVLLSGALLLAARGMNADQQRTFDLVNQSRAAAGLPALKEDNTATKKAQAWAEHLAAKGSLSHSNLASGMDDGWKALGENVGYGASIDHVHTQYMNSTGHRNNILNRGYTHLGTGVAQGNGRTYTVHVFVTR